MVSLLKKVDTILELKKFFDTLLNSNAFHFASTLNKSIEFGCFISKEMEALKRNGTWVVTNLLSEWKHVSCKCVYKVKYKAMVNLKETRLI